MRTFLIRAFSYIVGLMIVSFGVTLTILAGLGAGPWDALNVGLAHQTPFTVGNWVIFVGIILIIINAILTKSRPVIVSLLTIFLIGYFIDFWLLIVFPNIVFNGFWIQLLILLGGVVIIACGASVYLQAEFAIIPIDGFMFAVRDLFKVKLMVAKTITEVTALVAAFLVGGPIGVGTLIVTFSIGPLIQWFFPRVERKLNWKGAH
ncbi:membrane protein [Alkalihalobacillus sp. MEB130]|uniref:YczE/YyaS/YitT family protein n=1 Tax=Alkalihalobacillus sp. MEB130 TaxID=2976704 RepID=UPI0028DE03BD|nr:membrane protein [Alkalihalobacillus sp. MEB130]MDT8860950.1 membrane protein [Alkalihalobacillus sp. MEB130]